MTVIIIISLNIPLSCSLLYLVYQHFITY